jgi:hypothetical protein
MQFWMEVSAAVLFCAAANAQPAGVPSPLRELFRLRQSYRRESRACRPQQPHVYHGRTLGEGALRPDQDHARGSLPGLGEESKDFTLPNGTHETVYTFGHYLRRMVAEAREAGAHPVLLSLTVRNIWKDGKVERGNGRFSEWTAAIAKAAGVPFLDVMDAIAFPEDHTHTSPEGAAFNAQMVVSAIKGADLSLAALPILLLIGDSIVRNAVGQALA